MLGRITDARLCSHLAGLSDTNALALSSNLNIWISLSSDHNVILHQLDSIILTVILAILRRKSSKLLRVKYLVICTLLQ